MTDNLSKSIPMLPSDFRKHYIRLYIRPLLLDTCRALPRKPISRNLTSRHPLASLARAQVDDCLRQSHLGLKLREQAITQDARSLNLYDDPEIDTLMTSRQGRGSSPPEAWLSRPETGSGSLAWERMRTPLGPEGFAGSAARRLPRQSCQSRSSCPMPHPPTPGEISQNSLGHRPAPTGLNLGLWMLRREVSASGALPQARRVDGILEA